MVSLHDRALAVFMYAWRLLPPIKHEAYLTSIGLAQLGTKHGFYDPETGALVVNTRLFAGATPQAIPLFDIQGNSPPQVFPCISRALHTVCHELFHAVGAGTGLDCTPEWLACSGWTQAWDDPADTGRYFEARPGWEMGFSPWRYRTRDTFFVRTYSSKAPFEDFADCCTHITLGWTDVFSAPHPARANALAKLAYLRRHVWGETGTRALVAARERWQQHTCM
jgi:hypothetical protein